MNLVTIRNHDKKTKKELALQFITIYPTSSKGSEVERIEEPLRSYFIAPEPSDDEKAELQFQEPLYHQFEEWETIQSYIEVATHGKIFDTHYATTANPHIIDFGTSNTHLANMFNTANTVIDNLSGFCFNIGTPKSVIGSRTLSAFLRKLSHE